MEIAISEAALRVKGILLQQVIFSLQGVSRVRLGHWFKNPSIFRSDRIPYWLRISGDKNIDKRGEKVRLKVAPTAVFVPEPAAGKPSSAAKERGRDEGRIRPPPRHAQSVRIHHDEAGALRQGHQEGPSECRFVSIRSSPMDIDWPARVAEACHTGCNDGETIGSDLP